MRKIETVKAKPNTYNFLVLNDLDDQRVEQEKQTDCYDRQANNVDGCFGQE